MALRRAPRTIIYPESDGKPMVESDLHLDEMMHMRQTFQAAFADRAVYVTGNLLLYYQEGNPRALVSPDLMVVKGTYKGRRRTYLLWQEGIVPCFVMEITSSTKRREDRHKKMQLYARLGVADLRLYDPLAEYLRPPLQEYRLVDGAYLPMPLEHDGALVSTELGLRLVDGFLQVYDVATRRQIRSPAEQTIAAEPRARAAEARVAELEALLRQRNGHV